MGSGASASAAEACAGSPSRSAWLSDRPAAGAGAAGRPRATSRAPVVEAHRPGRPESVALGRRRPHALPSPTWHGEGDVKDGDGFISRVSPTCKLLGRAWVTGSMRRGRRRRLASCRDRHPTSRDVEIDIGRRDRGARSAARAAWTLGNAGCGDWTVGQRGRRACALSQAGSGDTRAGSAGEASCRVAGSGDITIGDDPRALDVDIAGSGDVPWPRSLGRWTSHVAGSGDVTRRRTARPRLDVAWPAPATWTSAASADSLNGPHRGLRRRARPRGDAARVR